MKKLYFCFIALLMLAAAHAQTPAQKAIVGTWNVTSVGSGGNIIELDTGKIVFTEETLKEVKDEGIDIEDAKAEFKALGDSYKNISFTFNTDGTLKMSIQGYAQDDTYKVEEVSGKQYIVFGHGPATEYSITDNVLFMKMIKRDEVVEMYFKKQ